MEKFVLENGQEIVDVSNECDYDALTPEEKVQYMMLQISRQLMKFITDIAVDVCVDDFFSAKITGDGTYYMVELCNGLTKVIVGKIWRYDEMLKLCTEPKGIEFAFNEFVRLAIVQSSRLTTQEETHWL